MRAQHAENLGVTLIDLIIVVTLMAVLAGIGLPRMTSMFTISTPEAAGVEAMTSVEYARSTSVASGSAGYVEQASAGASGTADFALSASEEAQMVTLVIAPATP